MRTVSPTTEKIDIKSTFRLITLAILKQSQRVILQNRYIKKKNKSSKHPSYAHTLFINLSSSKAYKNATSMAYNSRQQPFKHIVYKPKMTLQLSFIIFYYKTYFEKIMNFSLYTLVQNLAFSKKADKSMRNSAKVTNNVSDNRYSLVLIVCNVSFKILL